MAMLRREIVAQVKIGEYIVKDWLALRASHSLADPVARAQIVVPYPYGNYDEPVEIWAGSIPGNGMTTRFRGRRRKASFDLYPRACTIECVGELSKVAEYINWEEGRDPRGRENQTYEDPNGTIVLGTVGGLLVFDLVPDTPHPAGAATFKDIAMAVLRKAGIYQNPELLDCSGRYYGIGTDNGMRFLWHSGTVVVGPTNQVDIEHAFRRAGESALAYLQKYSQIDAVYDPGPPKRVGFFRIFEIPSGEIVIKLVGGWPGGTIDTDLDGRHIVFTEGGSAEIKNELGEQFPPANGTPNILSANFQRDYPVANRVLVVGLDLGAVQFHYEASVPLGPLLPLSAYRYDPSAPSSDWIDWQQVAAGWGGYESLDPDVRYGIDCETIAKARLEEVAREIVSGNLTTADDALLIPGQVHLVQAPAGLADRLGTGETLWCQGNDFELQIQNGAPVLTQTPTYLGGGLASALPTSAEAPAAP